MSIRTVAVTAAGAAEGWKQRLLTGPCPFKAASVEAGIVWWDETQCCQPTERRGDERAAADRGSLEVEDYGAVSGHSCQGDDVQTEVPELGLQNEKVVFLHELHEQEWPFEGKEPAATDETEDCTGSRKELLLTCQRALEWLQRYLYHPQENCRER